MKYQKGTFATTPNIMNLKGKPSEMQTIFLWLCQHANDQGQCYPSRRTLAKESGCGLKSVDKYIPMLEEAGFITKSGRLNEDGGQSSNMYQLLIMTMPVAEKVLKSSPSATPSDSESATQTKPSINQTQLTILPEKYGKNYIDRLMRVYTSLWYGIYKTPSTMNIGRLGKAFKTLMTSGLTEIQVAVLIYTYFNWYGGDGKTEKDHSFLVNAGFPMEIMLGKVDIMVAYITNNLKIQFSDEEKVRQYAVRVLKDVL